MERECICVTRDWSSCVVRKCINTSFLGLLDKEKIDDTDLDFLWDGVVGCRTVWGDAIRTRETVVKEVEDEVVEEGVAGGDGVEERRLGIVNEVSLGEEDESDNVEDKEEEDDEEAETEVDEDIGEEKAEGMDIEGNKATETDNDEEEDKEDDEDEDGKENSFLE